MGRGPFGQLAAAYRGWRNPLCTRARALSNKVYLNDPWLHHDLEYLGAHPGCLNGVHVQQGRGSGQGCH